MKSVFSSCFNTISILVLNKNIQKLKNYLSKSALNKIKLSTEKWAQVYRLY